MLLGRVFERGRVSRGRISRRVGEGIKGSGILGLGSASEEWGMSGGYQGGWVYLSLFNTLPFLDTVQTQKGYGTRDTLSLEPENRATRILLEFFSCYINILIIFRCILTHSLSTSVDIDKFIKK